MLPTVYIRSAQKVAIIITKEEIARRRRKNLEIKKNILPENAVEAPLQPEGPLNGILSSVKLS